MRAGDGKATSANDAWVSACCLAYQVPLATLNRRAYERIEDLQLVGA